MVFDQLYHDTEEGRPGTVKAIGNCLNLLPRTLTLESTYGSREPTSLDVPEHI